jgi:acylphosphatase
VTDAVDRALVVFRGTVQGVGFRYTTAQLARSYPDLTGEVRNLPDGTVQLTVEGARLRADALINDIIARMPGYIVSHSVQWAHGSRHHTTFRIGC